VTVYFKSFLPPDTPIHKRNKRVGLVLTEAGLQHNLCEFEFSPSPEWFPRLLRVKSRGLDFTSAFLIIIEWEEF
jgi:hypothetical protein